MTFSVLMGQFLMAGCVTGSVCLVQLINFVFVKTTRNRCIQCLMWIVYQTYTGFQCCFLATGKSDSGVHCRY